MMLLWVYAMFRKWTTTVLLSSRKAASVWAMGYYGVKGARLWPMDMGMPYLILSVFFFPAIPRADLVRTGLLQGVGTAKER